MTKGTLGFLVGLAAVLVGTLLWARWWVDSAVPPPLADLPRAPPPMFAAAPPPPPPVAPRPRPSFTTADAGAEVARLAPATPPPTPPPSPVLQPAPPPIRPASAPFDEDDAPSRRHRAPPNTRRIRRGPSPGEEP